MAGAGLGLELTGVSHRYGKRLAVDNITFGIAAGEILCLLGPSGCGKSTTLRIAAGLEELQQGEVRIGGRSMAGVPTEARHVGMVFQDHALFPHLTVADNIGFGLEQMSATKRRERILFCASRVGLDGFLGVYPHSLSGGEQQRVALARALAPEPKLLLLDEPFSSLDSRLRDQIRDDTTAVLKQAGTPALLVTHDPEEAMRMADRIAVMQAGRIAQIDRPGKLYEQPVSPFVARFFSETNEIPGRIANGRLDTPIGPILAPGIAEGSAALAVIRPEGLVEAEDDGMPCRVLGARTLGAFRRVEVVTDALPEKPLVARLPPGPLPMPGSRLNLGLSARAAWVFPAAG